MSKFKIVGKTDRSIDPYEAECSNECQTKDSKPQLGSFKVTTPLQARAKSEVI